MTKVSPFKVQSLLHFVFVWLEPGLVLSQTVFISILHVCLLFKIACSTNKGGTE